MTRNRILGALLVSALGVLTVPAARAAQLTQVTADWTGGTSFPSDVTMYIYVPDKVAANPPLLVLSHYCGGTAQTVFGQARGSGTTDGGVVQAADKYGFIMVVPSSGRCWDVTSTTAQTRDGKGDPQAIQQMVKYALDKYKANPDRVYATGDSSGAMMTELLMALYPDIFKAGAAFAGVPAGCSNIFDGSGLCGLPAQTAQQWGDRVRAMYKGYSGHRPRLQLFHGDADGTITYKNLAEAIKEWTNVLGLSPDPTSTQDTGLTLGTHQAKRQTWKNSCGYAVLDTLTSVGGDHGPSDALFEASYVIPFFGLDKTDAVDPEIAQCGGGTGDGGVGDAGGVGGAGGAGGSGAKDAGAGGSAGNTGAGGSSPAGGSTGSGGSSSSGGAPGTGGSQSSGGSAAGGAQASGGVVSTGGKSSTGGSAGSGSGGTSSNGGTTGNSTSGGGTSGCTCAVGGANSSGHVGIAMLVLGLALPLARRRRGRQ
jgi:poly(hydroxyalkanoate) depolymerase family esterase